jgi:anti-sigma regulatory factor (Ser/Thr protein kinase)
VSAPRGLGSPVADADDEVVRSPDTAAGHLARPPLAGPAPQPAPSAAGSRPSGGTAHNRGPAGPRRHWRLPATVRSVTVLRRALEDWLRQAQLSDDERYDLLLVACEATSNAIEHARNPTQPFVEVLAEIGDARVTITVCDSGSWRDAVAGTDRGRGLQMMWLLAETTVAAGRHGTTVTIRSSPRHGRLPAAPHGERGASNGSRPSCPGTG